MLWTIIGALILGTILGYVGKLLLPGRQYIPAWATIGAGIVAALLGGLVANWFGVDDTKGIDWWELLFQILFAVVGVAVVARIMGGRNTGVSSRNSNY
jgi:uncharacterized membrane protein YeaQ/YmgE (transglycosylase-associated protein family)